MSDAGTKNAETGPGPETNHSELAVDLDLTTHPKEGPLLPHQKRFDMFLIDTGWNAPVSRAVRQHLPLIYQYHRQDTLYILSPEQSIEALMDAPYLIGHDPTILVYDVYGSKNRNNPKYRGFRLNLGLLRHPEQALSRLNEFVRFVAQHRTAERLDQEVRREMQREGFNGMVKILREGLEASVELI